MLSEDEEDRGERDTTWWIRELHLYQRDKDTLSNDVELSDAIVNAAQSLLKSQYPDFSGFQSTLLSEGLKFTPISRSVNSVQILHTGKFLR